MLLLSVHWVSWLLSQGGRGCGRFLVGGACFASALIRGDRQVLVEIHPMDQILGDGKGGGTKVRERERREGRRRDRWAEGVRGGGGRGERE